AYFFQEPSFELPYPHTKVVRYGADANCAVRSQDMVSRAAHAAHGTASVERGCALREQGLNGPHALFKRGASGQLIPQSHNRCPHNRCCFIGLIREFSHRYCRMCMARVLREYTTNPLRWNSQKIELSLLKSGKIGGTPKPALPGGAGRRHRASGAITRS